MWSMAIIKIRLLLMDETPLLIESICIQDQKIQLLQYHNARANKSRSELYGISENINFNKIIDVNQATSKLVKCRIVYGLEIDSISYQPYEMKEINSLKTISIDPNWRYNHKFLDRNQLDRYYRQRGKSDDILMIQNGLVKDTYYGNVAFLKEGKWYTPAYPLLDGTRRSSLLDQGFISPRQIKREEIPSFGAIRIFNAMINFGEIEFSVDSIE